MKCLSQANFDVLSFPNLWEIAVDKADVLPLTPSPKFAPGHPGINIAHPISL